MIAQFVLTGLLLFALIYALVEYSSSRAVGVLAVLTSLVGLFLVWFPAAATLIAKRVGIGRGVDLVIYTWIGISLTVLLNLHLKLRTQMEVISLLARKITLDEARRPKT